MDTDQTQTPYRDEREREIYFAELAECGGRDVEARLEMAAYAVDLDRRWRTSLRCPNPEFRKGPKPGTRRAWAERSRDMPANQDQLRADSIAAALAYYQTPDADFHGLGNHRARAWAQVALAHAATNGHPCCVRNHLGPLRAALILGIPNINATTTVHELKKRDAEGYRAALDYSATVEIQWGETT